MTASLGERIYSRIGELARISDDVDGLTRLYLSPDHKKAAELVAQWMREAGMSVRIDAVGNVIGRREGAAPQAPALLIGSHIDTVGGAGRFDGCLGVVTAISVVGELAARNAQYPFAIEVIAFGDEEGVRFPSALGGSRAIAGTSGSTSRIVNADTKAAIDKTRSKCMGIALAAFNCDSLCGMQSTASRCINLPVSSAAGALTWPLISKS